MLLVYRSGSAHTDRRAIDHDVQPNAADSSAACAASCSRGTALPRVTRQHAGHILAPDICKRQDGLPLPPKTTLLSHASRSHLVPSQRGQVPSTLLGGRCVLLEMLDSAGWKRCLYVMNRSRHSTEEDEKFCRRPSGHPGQPKTTLVEPCTSIFRGSQPAQTSSSKSSRRPLLAA